MWTGDHGIDPPWCLEWWPHYSGETRNQTISQKCTMHFQDQTFKRGMSRPRFGAQISPYKQSGGVHTYLSFFFQSTREDNVAWCNLIEVKINTSIPNHHHSMVFFFLPRKTAYFSEHPMTSTSPRWGSFRRFKLSSVCWLQMPAKWLRLEGDNHVMMGIYGNHRCPNFPIGGLMNRGLWFSPLTTGQGW